MNPNPALITSEMWRLWTDRPNLAWKLGGIYADKKGYHNTVIVNKQRFKGNYSIELTFDLTGVQNKARAIDYTMSDTEMTHVTRWLRLSADREDDHRLAAVREFYGTLDNENVFGLIKDDLDGPWKNSTSDPSHLWHVHLSIFAKFVNQWEYLEPILSVISGQTLEEWNVSKEMFLPKLGDSGEGVNYWQRVYNVARKVFPTDLSAIEVDSDYGPATATAFTNFYKGFGGSGTYKGEAITGWIAMKLMESFTLVVTPKPDPDPPILNHEELKALVNDWLGQRINTDLVITGKIDGKVIL